MIRKPVFSKTAANKLPTSTRRPTQFQYRPHVNLQTLTCIKSGQVSLKQEFLCGLSTEACIGMFKEIIIALGGSRDERT